MTKAITSLDLFVEALESADPKEYVNIIKRLSIPAQAFEPYCNWNKGSYTRNCIKRTDDFELILICWDKHAKTQIHGHDGQRCWVYQIQGDIIEHRYGKLDTNELVEISNWKLRPASLTFMDDKMGYHQLVNESPGRSLTLHIYVNPIDECEVFDEENNRFFNKSLCYDSNAGKIQKNSIT